MNEILLVHLVLYITIILLCAAVGVWAVQKYSADKLKNPFTVGIVVIAGCLILIRLLATV